MELSKEGFPVIFSYSTVEPSLTATFFVSADSPYIDSCFNLSITATSLQRQLPLKCVPRRHNYLSTTASFFQQPMKKSRIDSYGAMKINRSNRILIVFHLYCCSKHKLSTTLITNVDNLARFVYFWHFDSKHQVCLCILFALSLWDTVSTNLTQQINRTSLKKNLSYYTPASPQVGHFLLSLRWPLWRGSTVLSLTVMVL